MMFSRLLNQIDRIQLNKIAKSLSKLKDCLQEEQAEMNGCTVLLERYSRPVCGMERHGDYIVEKTRLLSEKQQHAHVIARDEAARVAFVAQAQKLTLRIERRRSARKAVGFSFHRSASFH
jgi:hypothetical protein